jgi:Transposase IS4
MQLCRHRGESVPNVGIQCSVHSVNSPIKSWQQVFTDHIMETVCKYSNEYGNIKCGRDEFDKIDKESISEFIAVLFVSSIQRRKDKVSNWWSNNPLLENPIIKKIMTGRKFYVTYMFALSTINLTETMQTMIPAIK